jgi:hypothetical protein
VLENSTWVADSSVYRLTSCPTGYSVYNESEELQTCQVCGLGVECVLGSCKVCTPCQPGSFKSESAPVGCSLCPANTYGPEEGATALAQCLSCPDFASTEGEGEWEHSPSRIQTLALVFVCESAFVSL